MKSKNFLILSITAVWLLSMLLLLAGGAHDKQPSRKKVLWYMRFAQE